MPNVKLPDHTPLETWQISKPAITGAKGVVASQNIEAAQVGASVLEEGGNAIDAAIATALALTVSEPWMSGLGGGGFAIVHHAKSGETKCLDFGMIASKGLDTANYPILEGKDAPPDLFGWPAVVEDRNLQGYHSIAVPGSCAGYAKLLGTYGSWSWADTIAPAVALAERGHKVTWWSTLQVAAEAGWLRNYETSKQVWMPNDLPPIVPDGAHVCLDMGEFAATLRRLQQEGPSDFYQGEIAKKLVRDLNEGGSPISLEDLASYEASWLDPIERKRSGHTYHLPPGYSAGPTFAGALTRIPESFAGSAPDADAYKAYADSLIQAYRVRLETMGHAGDVSDRSCTTHLCTADSEGNMVSMTTTLLSRFGSRVVLPSTGVLMNNGVNWFDPRPGRPNSLAAGQRPLSNMAPVLATQGGKARFALGASGGRKILPCNFQLSSFIADYGMDLDTAFQQPRVDVSLIDQIIADSRLDEATMAALRSVAPVDVQETVAFPANWSIPCAVMNENGALSAASHVFGPLNGAVGA